MKKFKTWAVNGVIMAVSCLIALLLCEFASRLVLDPVDYLSPRLVRDAILGIRLPPHSSGHDGWGFRNKTVPESADIVTIGDSHTYGNCAKMRESWPHVLSRLQSKTVYNLGLGGYGPNQYYQLLRTKALMLKPRTIVCGIYMGDDFDNAYRITYGLPYWQDRRQRDFKDVDADIWGGNASVKPSFQKRFRNWLSQHSVLYRIVVHGMLMNVKGRFQIRHASDYESGTALIIPERNIEEAFRPKGVLRGLMQNEPSVKEGMRLTFHLLKEMNAMCQSNHIRFVVAIIPTKESVYAEHLENNSKLAMSDILSQVIAGEQVARRELVSVLKQENIAFVDLLPTLTKAREQKRIYTYGASDMHPNNHGYRAIAEAVSQFLSAPPGK